VAPPARSRNALQSHAPLLRLLDLARERGFAGPADPVAQVARSLAFAQIVEAPSRALDLGSGAGLPGMVLALEWPCSLWWLLESSHKRAGWLREAVAVLGLEARCEVVEGRAETLARSSLRESFPMVTARGFGPAAATAECGAPFLQRGGQLLVAEPPLLSMGAPTPSGARGPRRDRWPSSGLSQLGLRLKGTRVVETDAGPVTLSRLVAVARCPERYPRREGVPFKRLLF
jgi:16S rRNA (guanine527-N7)-methyltransferase